MWTIEHSLVAAVEPEAIWRLWSDVANWPIWDDDFERVDLHGAFEVGTSGALFMPGQDGIPFTLTSIEPNHAFEDVTEFAGAALRFYHRIDPADGGHRITHGAEITGPGAAAVSAMIGENLAHGMVKAVSTLANLASKAVPARG
jgi:hypothetical protein